jgi:hypothetical protein
VIVNGVPALVGGHVNVTVEFAVVAVQPCKQLCKLSGWLPAPPLNELEVIIVSPPRAATAPPPFVAVFPSKVQESMVTIPGFVVLHPNSRELHVTTAIAPPPFEEVLFLKIQDDMIADELKPLSWVPIQIAPPNELEQFTKVHANSLR